MRHSSPCQPERRQLPPAARGQCKGGLDGVRIFRRAVAGLRGPQRLAPSQERHSRLPRRAQKATTPHCTSAAFPTPRGLGLSATAACDAVVDLQIFPPFVSQPDFGNKCQTPVHRCGIHCPASPRGDSSLQPPVGIARAAWMVWGFFCGLLPGSGPPRGSLHDRNATPGSRAGHGRRKVHIAR